MSDASIAFQPTPSREPIAFMVVDDDPLTVQMIANAVRPLGRVAFVQDFPNTVLAVYNTHPRLVFLDVDLPGKTGLEINRQIRANHELDDVYVVMITSHDSATVQKMVSHAQADEILQKPLDPKAVYELAQRLLSQPRMVGYTA